jgi:hypothetical protein
MGMLDSLGPTILGKPTQIISFATNIVNDHVDRMSQEKDLKTNISNIVQQNDNDDDFSLQDDFESLILAINLLRAVMHGKVK